MATRLSDHAEPVYAFKAFLSYSTDPDYRLAREVERFLEAFHKSISQLPDGRNPEPLKICRDGSDFKISAIKQEFSKGTDTDDLVRGTIAEYLEQSEFLIVFCSRNAAESVYVDYEVGWFLKNRPSGILLAVTESEAPEETGEVFAPSIVKASLHQSIYFDFRGWRPNTGLSKVRNFEEAKVNLASHLYGFTEGQLLPLWLREERKRARKRTRVVTGAVAVLLILLGITGGLFMRTTAQNRQLRSDVLVRDAQMILAEDVVRSIQLTQEAIDQNPSSHAYAQLLAALNTLDNVKRVLDVHQVPATQVVFGREGMTIYSTDIEYGLATTDIKTHTTTDITKIVQDSRPIFNLTSGNSSIGYMGATDIDAAQDHVFVGTDKGEVVVLETQFGLAPRPFQRLSLDTPVLAVAASIDGLFVGGDDGSITHYRRGGAEYERVASWTAHDGPVYDLAVSAEFLGSGGGDGIARLWELNHLRLAREVRSEFNGPYYAVAFSSDGKILALGGNHAKVQLLDIPSLDVSLLASDLPNRIECLDFHPDGKILAVCAGNKVALFDVSRGSSTPVRMLAGHTRPDHYYFSFQKVAAAAFSPDGSDLVTVGPDGRLFVRDIKVYTFGPDFVNLSLPIPRPALVKLITSFEQDLDLEPIRKGSRRR
ncbi:MAG: TIR domain-containing protein [Bacteroidota bacterium]